MKYTAEADFVGKLMINSGVLAKTAFSGSILLQKGKQYILDFQATPLFQPNASGELNCQANVSIGVLPIITFDLDSVAEAAVGLLPKLILQGTASSTAFPAANLPFASNELCKTESHYVELQASGAVLGKVWIVSSLFSGGEIEKLLYGPSPLYRHCLFPISLEVSVRCISA